MKKIILVLAVVFTTSVFAVNKFDTVEGKKNTRKITMKLTYTDGYNTEESIILFFDSAKEAETYYLESILTDEIIAFCEIYISSSYTNSEGKTCTERQERVQCSQSSEVVAMLRAKAKKACSISGGYFK